MVAGAEPDGDAGAWPWGAGARRSVGSRFCQTRALAALDRQVPLQTCVNFRDLGGYRTATGGGVRRRRLFRSDSLHQLSDADLEVARGLGLRTVIDLRSHSELEQVGAYPVARHPVDLRHLPVFASRQQMERLLEGWTPDAPPGLLYLSMAELGPSSIAETLRLLSRPETYPAVFHCTAGKDRTGIVAALVLGLLGVPEEEILDDYALSQQALGGIRRTEAMVSAVTNIDFDRLPREVRGADRATMAGFLALLDRRYGSVRGYVASLGVGEDVVAALAAQLVEGEPPAGPTVGAAGVAGPLGPGSPDEVAHLGGGVDLPGP